MPAFTLNRVDRPRPLAETLADLDELNDEHDHFEFYVFPHTETALCRESRRTDEPPRPRPRAAVYAQEVVLENWVGQLLALAGRHLPSQVPRLARIAAGGRRALDQGRSQLPRLRQRAADQVHGDGVRDPARARRRGGAPGARVAARARAAGRLPDRGPLRRRPTTPC